jgi:hypothetical protein
MKITKELLSDLLDTAMCSCSWLEIKTLKSEKHLDVQFSEDYLTYRYFYEKCADRLLAGGHIICYDYEDENEKGEPKRYELQLSDFEKRLHEAPFSDDLSVVESFCNWRLDNYDYYDCNNLLQYVIFGQIIYG